MVTGERQGDEILGEAVWVERPAQRALDIGRVAVGVINGDVFRVGAVRQQPLQQRHRRVARQAAAERGDEDGPVEQCGRGCA